MKSVSLLGDNINLFDTITHTGTFNLDNEKINVGLVENDYTDLLNIKYSDYEVVVKKNAFSCNFRDRAIILSYNSQIKELAKIEEFTYGYMGSEFVGEVIKVGEKVLDLKIGDRVISNVQYPSYNFDYDPGIISNHCSERIDVFPENKLIKIPLSLSDDVATVFSVAAFTAYSMIRKSVKNNSKVLITAAKSNTSLAVISALKNFPVEVYALTSSHVNNEKLLQLGVKEVFIIDHEKNSYLDNEKIKQFVNKKGLFDTVIDPFFDIHLSRITEIMNFNSKYVTCGFERQNKPEIITTDPYQLKKIMKSIMEKNISIIGNCLGHRQDFELALDHFEKGYFNIPIDRIYSEGDEAGFFDRTYNNKERFGKVIYMYND